eukprot:m.41612 g.41612  ORF g.41612 m.41612 type:complete len:279 (-) comp11843_c1_seq2:188-1024(-)
MNKSLSCRTAHHYRSSTTSGGNMDDNHTYNRTYNRTHVKQTFSITCIQACRRYVHHVAPCLYVEFERFHLVESAVCWGVGWRDVLWISSNILSLTFDSLCFSVFLVCACSSSFFFSCFLHHFPFLGLLPALICSYIKRPWDGLVSKFHNGWPIEPTEIGFSYGIGGLCQASLKDAEILESLSDAPVIVIRHEDFSQNAEKNIQQVFRQLRWNTFRWQANYQELMDYLGSTTFAPIRSGQSGASLPTTEARALSLLRQRNDRCDKYYALFDYDLPTDEL